MWSTFVEVAVRHLEVPPGDLEELHEGAELWAFNTDFSLEFPQPLLPFTVLVGGLLNHPAKPLEQVCGYIDYTLTRFCFFFFTQPAEFH